MALRDYQTDAVNAIRAALETDDKALLVMPTGTGKTVVFAEIVKEWKRLGERTLILAHTGQLLVQARDKLISFGGLKGYEVGMEKAEQSVTEMRVLPPVVVASKDSLHSKRRAKFRPDAFTRIIVDECHRGVAATYKRIYDHFNVGNGGAKILGVTATPQRRDKRSVAAMFGKPCYVYEIRDAIEQQYLVPISLSMVHCDGIDLESVRVVAGDLNEADLERVMMTERTIHEVAVPIIEQAEQRQTLVFCTSVAHAAAIAEVLNRYKPGSARAIDGSYNDAEREKVYRDFGDKRFQYLCNCALLLEGYDEPNIACVAMARPTTSKTLYCQAVGRGTRLLGLTYPESIENGKRDLLLLDFVGNSGKHNLVCGLDAIDSGEDDEVRAEAMERAKKNGGPIDVLDTLKESETVVAERSKAKLIASVQYRVSKLDPFSVLGIHPRAGRWGGSELTEAQRYTLEGFGLKAEEIARIDKGQASETIEALIQRQRRGLCTYKQARQLAKYGFDTDAVSFESASAIMTKLHANGWKMTPDIRALAQRLTGDVPAYERGTQERAADVLSNLSPPAQSSNAPATKRRTRITEDW